MRTQLAILVPVYRNAATVADLARRIEATLTKVEPVYRLVFVVDASPDNSWEIIRQLAQDDDRICGILLSSNQGQHRALMTGLQQIRALRTVVMDADLQDPPELLPELIAECARKGVTVFARRDGQYQPWGRMLTSRMFKYLLGRLIDLPADVGSYFVIPEAVATTMRCAQVRHVQLVVMARLFSPTWSSVRYVRLARDQGKSAYSSWGRLRSALTSLACLRECRRWMQGKPSTTVKDWHEASSMIVDRVNI